MVTYVSSESGSSLEGGPRLADLAQGLRRASVRLGLAVERLAGGGKEADEAGQEVLREVAECLDALANEAEWLAHLGATMIRLLPSVHERLVKHVTPVPQRTAPAVDALTDGPLTPGVMAAVFANVAVARAVRTGMEATEACAEWGSLIGAALGSGQPDGQSSVPGQSPGAHSRLLRQLVADLACRPVDFLSALYGELQVDTPQTEPAVAG
ncbi:MAG: hypothetical protein GXX88_10020 [Candidatus Hydrogenedentes bacterium]|nr:hypothetical protein [Candidatus Hydrogenedentota bacterium]